MFPRFSTIISGLKFPAHSGILQVAHYDCVLASMKFEQPIPSDIQFPIRDGLRAWVNAAATVEEALSLRVPDCIGGAVEFFDQPWNDEDGELLVSSMKELDAEQSSDV